MTTSGLSASAPDVLWASALGVGFLRPAPGTWGSIAALGVWAVVLTDLAWTTQLALLVVYALSGWWASARICRRCADKDAPEIVADEVAGMWLALLMVPASWGWWLVAFLLFRAFDIVKPGPIGWLDRNLAGGAGVMADDILAGAATGGVLAAAAWGFRAAGITA